MAPRAQGKRVKRKGRAKNAEPRKIDKREKAKHSLCPIVGIGGSAGGFEATMQLLRSLPAKNGMSFVVVQHLDPHHASRLANLLGRVTDMPVMELSGATVPQRNAVYVQPPNKCVTYKNGMLRLARRTEKLNLAIDHFFESLAEGCGRRAIGVILSGTGSDGTAGLRAIKAAGGLTFAQDESAKFVDMPRSAIRSGFVDVVLPPDKIARELRHVVAHPYIRKAQLKADADTAERATYRDTDSLGRIFLSLKKQMGVDFSNYKQGTLLRRIQRRMVFHKVTTLGQYARLLRDNNEESEALFNDLLINVTRFFRDPGLFTALKKRFLPALLKKKDKQGEVRAWVPGCATGEEVYSLAICILEALGSRAYRMKVHIFGTDLSEAMIDHARAGIFSTAIQKDVSPARLKRFFVKREGSYQISRNVRELCTFARQNVTTDPPFSRLDLISCRNVFIYLGPELHKRCLPQFHHALNPDGYLILGPAESVGTFDELFKLVDKKNKIYVKKAVPTPHSMDFANFTGAYFPPSEARSTSGKAGSSAQLLQAADQIMLGAYAPAAVIVDSNMRVQQFRGRTENYLEHTAGPATLNLLHIVRPSLLPDVRNAIHRATKSNKPVRTEGALVRVGGAGREINLQVVPFKTAGSEKSWFLVIFDETTRGSKPGKIPVALGKTASQREISTLRRELSASNESVQSQIEEQDATNEELTAANEEIESSNEELQSTNEELETAKEELQSSNEELTTLNEELSNRNLEAMQMNSDLQNLLASMQLPIVMVDSLLKVRWATPSARDAFNVLPTDVGRPFRELRPNIEISGLQDILRKVIKTLEPHEQKVKGHQGRQFSLRVRPYRTADNKIDGAVVTLVDIDGTNEKDSSPSKGLTRRKRV